MKVVSLGWGSLVWDPKLLPVTAWHNDGPLLPIEFTRVSNDGRVTLVLDESAQPVPVLWTELEVATVEEAREALKVREGVPSTKSIGKWPNDSPYPLSSVIAAWADGHGIDAVVWTALKVGFTHARGARPSLAQLVEHLTNLDPGRRPRALEYVLKAPNQVQTEFRQTLVKALL